MPGATGRLATPRSVECGPKLLRELHSVTSSPPDAPIFPLEIEFLPSIVALGHVPGKRPLSPVRDVPVQFAPDKRPGISV